MPNHFPQYTNQPTDFYVGGDLENCRENRGVPSQMREIYQSESPRFIDRIGDTWYHVKYSKLCACVLMTLLFFACLSIYTISILAEMGKESRSHIVFFQQYNANAEGDTRNGIYSNNNYQEGEKIVNDIFGGNPPNNFEQISRNLVNLSSRDLPPLVRSYVLTFKEGEQDTGPFEYSDAINLSHCVSSQFSRFVYRFQLLPNFDSWAFYPQNINGQGIPGLSLESLVNFSLCCKIAQSEFQCSESQNLNKTNSALVAIIITNHETGEHFLKIKFTHPRLASSQCILNFVSEECT